MQGDVGLAVKSATFSRAQGRGELPALADGRPEGRDVGGAWDGGWGGRQGVLSEMVITRTSHVRSNLERLIGTGTSNVRNVKRINTILRPILIYLCRLLASLVLTIIMATNALS